jgi:GNAT superfamily N-acetyltransferase
MRRATKPSDLKIRRAKSSDSARLAILCTELGYPATANEMKARLSRITPLADHAVFVAETAESEVIGWLHTSASHLLESPRRAEVNGLVVGDGQRSKGAGALLINAAENWARKRKCVSMSVRSNVVRERAHAFYQHNGYEHYKTQKAFRKPL